MNRSKIFLLKWVFSSEPCRLNSYIHVILCLQILWRELSLLPISEIMCWHVRRCTQSLINRWVQISVLTDIELTQHQEPWCFWFLFPAVILIQCHHGTLKEANSLFLNKTSREAQWKPLLKVTHFTTPVLMACLQLAALLTTSGFLVAPPVVLLWESRAIQFVHIWVTATKGHQMLKTIPSPNVNTHPYFKLQSEHLNILRWDPGELSRSLSGFFLLRL